MGVKSLINSQKSLAMTLLNSCQIKVQRDACAMLSSQVKDTKAGE